MQTTYIYEEIPNVKQTLENKCWIIFFRGKKKTEVHTFAKRISDSLKKLLGLAKLIETKERPEEGKGEKWEKKGEKKLGCVGA